MIPLMRTDEGESAYVLPKQLATHCIAVGTTGSGKTVTIKRVAHGLAATGTSLVVLDYKGDLSGLAEPLGDDIAPIDDMPLPMDPVGLPSRLWSIDGRPGHRLTVAISDLPIEVMSDALGLSGRMADQLSLVIQEHGEVIYRIDDLIKAVDRAARRGIGTQRLKLAKATATAINTRLALAEHTVGHMFGPTVPLDELAGPKGTCNIVSLSATPDRAAASPESVALLAAYLFHSCSRLPEYSGPPKVAIVADEISLWLGYSKADKSAYAAGQALNKAVRVCRSKGVALVLGSQSLSDFSPQVLRNVGTLFLHRHTMSDRSDVAAMRSISVAFEGLQLDQITPTLSPGEAVARISGTVAMGHVYLPPSSIVAISDEGLERLIMDTWMPPVTDTPTPRPGHKLPRAPRPTPEAMRPNLPRERKRSGNWDPIDALRSLGDSRVARSATTSATRSATTVAVRAVLK